MQFFILILSLCEMLTLEEDTVKGIRELLVLLFQLLHKSKIILKQFFLNWEGNDPGDIGHVPRIETQHFQSQQPDL